MDGGQITAIVIVAIVMIASVIRASVRSGHRQAPGGDQMLAENKRLHGEVEQLKDRIKVLERITVEKENTLSREIESLRDR